MKLCRRRAAIAAALAAGGIQGLAYGSGFQLMEQNASGLGNAYAGQAAAAENASTIFFNPAGMTRLPGRQISGALNAILPSTKFSDSGASRSPLGQPLGPGGTNGGDAGDWAFVPNLYVSWQVAPSWWVGIGANAPFGLKTEYDADFIGRFQSQRSEVKTIDINPSVAFRVNDALSIGAGLSWQKGELKIDRSAFVGVAAPAQLRLDDDAWGYNLGVLASLGKDLRIGLAYRSALEYDLTGTSVVSGIPLAGTAVNGVAANIKLPDTLSWSIAYAATPRWEILGDITYTWWSKIKSVPVVATTTSVLRAQGQILDTFNLQFKDSYRIGVGLNYRWREDFTWKFGIAYDKTPVPDAFRTTFLPDQDRTWVAVGGKYRFSKQAALDVGYAHLFIKDASIDQQRGIGVLGAQGNVVGRYDADVNLLSVQLTYSF
ncbi:MAG TPA: OmpP1/FadL family transporter [Burkholderiales bacterium]|nr:OmpP1/FadL family transporter [Burkholderiales bacterium]